ncbi:MAG: hypothetical protein WBA57_08765 [Elainellaceae cyanobacterium]
MAQFTLGQLDAQLPAGTLTETADDVTISLKTLTGETSVQLPDEVIGEAIHKLLMSCQRTQADFNQTADPVMTSFPSVTAGSPRSDGAGGYKSTFQHSISIFVPVNVDAATASPV